MTQHRLSNKTVLVIGLGISGSSAVRFLLARGAHVIGIDQKATAFATFSESAPNLKLQLDTEPVDFSKIDLVVVSPGISPQHPLYAQAMEASVDIIGEVELACREIKNRCIGVTGTNGKTTVTLLVEHVLNQAGKPAKSLGNVGTPLTSALDSCASDSDEIYVIELSSFQLETLKHQFLDVGVLLNITPDHLDRYESLFHYAAAKARIFEVLKPKSKLYVEDKCLQEYPSLFKDREVFTYGYTSSCTFSCGDNSVFFKGTKQFDLPPSLVGKRSHDIENMMAAYALCREMGVSTQEFLSGFNTFKKPSHRIEFVCSINDVRYYDDSKGTNIDAVIRAVDAVDGSIVLIAGGVDKGFPYSPWIPAFDGRVKAICAIGQAAEKMKRELGPHIPVEVFQTLQDAVVYASKLAEKGSAVLLSPGCSSFDMFKDYAHRGKEFQRLVKAL